ncbi:MAG: metallophosphoesterase [Proteobacteria bacterium]|nr:metallophosphoesterase [Pseudomonadota bacterium]MBU1417472.1 metallophosphoesterase [Pseudomonadota bacterium]MBU1454348.1 metallophosphoesterase [Pseudomonadota bacterium]
MNILHISDLHFGPRHWEGDDQMLLDKINSYHADLVINTGDSTTDGLEDEYLQAGSFLKSIQCKNVISTIGNHDKRNMRSHELFRKYICDFEIISIPQSASTHKKHLFLDRKITKVAGNFTDINSIIQYDIKGKRVVVVTIDSNELYSDDGFVEKEVLKAVSEELNQIEYDHILLLTHYSILGTDECPLKNSGVLIDFVHKHNIEYVFCGHTHDLELMRTTDIYNGHSFNHFRCGSLSSSNIENDDNMFVYYENLGSDNMHLSVIRIFQEQSKVRFKEELVF